jgi:AAA domain (dynein-related subfamily)
MKPTILRITSKPTANSKVIDSNLAEEIDKFLGEDAEAVAAGYAKASGEDPDFDLKGTGTEAPEGSVEDLMMGQKELDTWDRMVFSDYEEDWEIQLESAMINGANLPPGEGQTLLIVGESGVGKSTMINQLAAKYLNTPVAYFNCPTMDPFVHLVGIPDIGENKETGEKVLNFVRKEGIEKCELLVLDEINRVPPSTQAALFELVAERKINGKEVGLLKMVWGAMNPPRSDVEGVSVEDVERAFQGRFMEIIPVLAKPKIRHYAGRKGIGAYVAHKCLKWWWQFIEGEGEKGFKFKDIITPRVLEYIMIKLQGLENRKRGIGPKDKEGRPLHRELTARVYNAEFDSITHHNKLSKDTVGLTLPFNELKMAFMGKELFALSALMDGSPDLPITLKKIQDPNDPDTGMSACQTIAQGIKTDRLHPHALVPWYRIGEFSTVLTHVSKEEGNKIISGQPQIAGFLFAKCAGSEAQREALKKKFSNNNMSHPIWNKTTQGEFAIYNRYKYEIDGSVKESERMAREAAAEAGKGPGVVAAPTAKPVSTTTKAPAPAAKKVP